MKNAFTRKLVLNSDRRLWQGFVMDRGRVIQTLRAHQAEWIAATIVHLHLFGSVARGEASADSEVDLSPADSMKEPVRERAVLESVFAF